MTDDNFPIKPALYVCDNYQTHDFLWVQNFASQIQKLIENSFQGHFPSLDAITLIERYAPQNGFNYARDWTIKVFRLYENLGKTGIINNDALTGKLYFDDAPYQSNKLPTSLGFTAIPDKLKIKVTKFAKVSFYERSHEEKTGRLETVNQSVSIWWRKELSFIEGEFEISISKLLFNSLVIEGDYQLKSPKNDLLFYSDLDKTIDKIIDLLPTPKILNFWDAVIVSKYQLPNLGTPGYYRGGYSMGYLHTYKEKAYKNPNYLDVPDCYSYSCLITANNDVWKEGNSSSDMGKKVTVKIEFDTINLSLWKTLDKNIEYSGFKDFKIKLPYQAVGDKYKEELIGIEDISLYFNVHKLSGYNLLREIPTYIQNNFRKYIDFPFSDAIDVPIVTAQNYKVYEEILVDGFWQNPPVYQSNGKDVSLVNGIEIERKVTELDKSLQEYSKRLSNLEFPSYMVWFNLYGYHAIAEPPWTYDPSETDNIGYGIAVDSFFWQNQDGSNTLHGSPVFPYNPAFLIIDNSPEIETNLIQGTTMPVVWDSFVAYFTTNENGGVDVNWSYQNQSRVYQFNNLFDIHKMTVVSNSPIFNKKEDRGNLTINQAELDGFELEFRLKRDFYFTALPSIPSNPVQEIKNYIENFPKKDKEIEWSFLGKSKSNVITVNSGKGIILSEPKNITLSKNAWVGFLGNFKVTINGNLFDANYNKVFIDKTNNNLQEVNFLMTDSPRVKEIHERLKLLSDWMGVAQQPDGTIKEYPAPYHVEGTGDSTVSGLQFAAFGKNKPSDTHCASVYEVLSNRVSQSKLGTPTIKSGGLVKIFNFPQLLETMKWDFGKALGVQESGGISVPKGDNTGTVTYQSQLAMQVDSLYTLSRLTKDTNELIIQAARTQAQLQSLLAATGCPIIPQKIPFDINGKVGHAIVGVLHPRSTTILGEIGVLKANMGVLVGANLTRSGDEPDRKTTVQNSLT